MKNIYKRISAAIIAIALTIMLFPMSKNATVSADSAIWDGTSDATWASGYTDNADTSHETFTISTAEQLAQLAVKVNSGLNFIGKTIELTDNIVLNSNAQDYSTWGTTPPANPWTRIGFNGSPFFGGTFDGKGHTVSGIYINKTGTGFNDGFQGLFGYSKGTIKNVSVINSYIKGYMNIGGIVAQTFAGTDYVGTVTNCYYEGIVIGNFAVGGIVGWSLTNCKVSNCYNTGTVIGTDMVAGIVGENKGSEISNCYNTGSISGDTNVGGVAGKNYGTNPIVTNCYYYGYNLGVGNQIDEAGKTTPFVKITDNPLGTGKTTTIAEQTTTDINTAWSDGLGSDFSVDYTNTYTSSDTGVATISGTTISGVSIGTSTISGRTMTITQNELTATGFDGALMTIVIPITFSLNVTADGGGTALVNAVTPTFDTNLSGSTTYAKDAAATALEVLATVTDMGTVSYQWYTNTENNNTTGTEILGATNATYTPPTDTAGTSYYYVIATNTNPSVTGTQTATATSGVKTIVISALVDAETPSFSTNLSGTDTYTKDTTATALTVSATVTDGGTVSYQWYKNTTNSTTGGTAISGAASATYTPPTDTAGTSYYYVIATNTNNSAAGTKTATATSGIKTIVVNTAIIPLIILNQPQGFTVNTGETATLTVAASGSGTLSYQWYSNTISSNIGGTAITGATYSTYSAPTTSAGTTYYYCVVTDIVTGKTVTTLAVKVEVISNLNPSTPTNPSSTSTPTSSSNSNSSKTITVVETPTGIENPQLIGVKASDNAFNQSVEVKLKDDAAAKRAIEQALTEEYADILKDVTIFPLDISLYIKGTNTKVQPNAGASVEITCPIPTELLANKDNIKIVCVVDGKLQILPTKVILKDGVYCVVFTASHFSPYAFLVSKDIQAEDVAAGASITVNANTVTDDASPIGDNGLPYAVVLIGFAVFGIIRKLSKEAK